MSYILRIVQGDAIVHDAHTCSEDEYQYDNQNSGMASLNGELGSLFYFFFNGHRPRRPGRAKRINKKLKKHKTYRGKYILLHTQKKTRILKY